MNLADRDKLYKLIDDARVVSFDVFDTLLYRKVNTPETIFELIGKHFNISGFKKLRIDSQNEASRRLAPKGYPHPDMDEIYEVLAEHTEIPVDWADVKDFEYQIETDALVANPAMRIIYDYAVKSGSRIIATTDMYLRADFIGKMLAENGFDHFDAIYCSADERKAKFNKELFEEVIKREGVAPQEILHIGDSPVADVEYPESFGMKAFLFKPDADMDKVKKAAGSDMDKALYKILCNSDKGFWYNLGAEIGGPMYFGLLKWIESIASSTDKTIYFLARDGYNLYKLLEERGCRNVRYLYASRRSLVLAGITDTDEESLSLLPPYTTDQRISDILEYLGIDEKDFLYLEKEGFSSYEDILDSGEKRDAFRRLYVRNREAFLKLCEREREAARTYFAKEGLLSDDSILFDCGWNGTSQYMLDRLKKALGCAHNDKFYYFGILSTDKSRKQLRGMHYETYLFDHCTNLALQQHVYEAVALYELFFSAPHQSVYKYDESGVVLEPGDEDTRKADILKGISDFIKADGGFAAKYAVDIAPQMSVGPFRRLLEHPTQEEAVTIGDVESVDSFARRKGQTLKIASVTYEQLEKNPKYEIYWIDGLLAREDIPYETRELAAKIHHKEFPVVEKDVHLEDTAVIRNYARWLRHRDMLRSKERPAELKYRPSFSVVVPVYNVVSEQLCECIDSVLNQTYDNYELILVDDCSTWPNVRETLKTYEGRPKVKIIYREKNGHISESTNTGINEATGDFIVFSDCDDMLDEWALYSFAKKLNEDPELDFIYSDEDKITEDGTVKHMPFFKPDWSPNLYMSMNYTNHLSVYRTSLVKKTGGLRSEFNGSQDYDFTLRFLELSDNKKVGHIPDILYHWRERKESVAYAIGSKNYAAEAAGRAKEAALKRRGISGYMELETESSQYRTVYEPVGNPLVSIVIPSKDHPGLVKQCTDSIRDYTDYKNYEIIVVDNGSSAENRLLYEKCLASVNGTYIYDPDDFNFSKMCNTGARAANGDYILFLNDDIEAFRPQWLSRMLGQAMRPDTGAVGAKLYYPYTTMLQHEGVINTEKGPMHMVAGDRDDATHYFGMNRIDYDCIAVTGACLLLEKKKFDSVGGFDESFPIAFNDVDLCFKLYEAGYYNVLRNDVILYHHESLSRGTDQVEGEKLLRLGRELDALFTKHPDLKGRDPFLNPNITEYGVQLQLKEYFDDIEEVSFERAEAGSMAFFDQVIMGDVIFAYGWCYIDGVNDYRSLTRYVLLEDPFGSVKGINALCRERGDIEEAHPEWSDARYTGFEIRIRKQDTRADIMPYRLGVMTLMPDGRRLVCWCGEQIPVERYMEEKLQYTDCKALPEKYTSAAIVTEDRNHEVIWYMDDFEEYEGGYLIKGFAFADREDHYRFDLNVLLVSDDGDVISCKRQILERVDVASYYPLKHFLYNTGFRCLILENKIDKDKTYRLIIRLQNRENPAESIDVETGCKIINGKAEKPENTDQN